MTTSEKFRSQKRLQTLLKAKEALADELALYARTRQGLDKFYEDLAIALDNAIDGEAKYLVELK